MRNVSALMIESTLYAALSVSVAKNFVGKFLCEQDTNNRIDNMYNTFFIIDKNNSDNRIYYYRYYQIKL